MVLVAEPDLVVVAENCVDVVVLRVDLRRVRVEILRERVGDPLAGRAVAILDPHAARPARADPEDVRLAGARDGDGRALVARRVVLHVARIDELGRLPETATRHPAVEDLRFVRIVLEPGQVQGAVPSERELRMRRPAASKSSL